MGLIEKTFSWNAIPSSHRLMMLIVCALGVLNLFWGEKVPAGDGFGWDGVMYADMVRHIDAMIRAGELSGYYAQRILPATLVRCMLLGVGAPLSAPNIIRGFELYNLTLLVGAVWVWKRVAGDLSLSLAGRWIGFSGIFINFACSKQAFYYPVLTDVTALFVAMLLLLFQVEKRPLALFLTTVAGAFCWPVVSVCGALLLIFLGAQLPQSVIAPAPPAPAVKPTRLLGRVRRAVPALLVLYLLLYLALIWLAPLSGPGLDHGVLALANLVRPSAVPRLEKLLLLQGSFALVRQFLTALPSIAALLVVLAMLIGSRSFLPALLASIVRARLPLVALAGAAFLIPALLVRMLSNPHIANVSGLFLLIKLILLPQDGKFFLPMVSLAVFWGPLVLLLALRWGTFCVQARRLGPGVVAVIGISLLLGLVGEPRFLTLAWPFLVLGITLDLEGVRTRAPFRCALVIITVVFSQFWLRINAAPWPQPDTEGILLFPKQLYFMHLGLWMSWWSYSVQGVLLVLTALWLRRTLRGAPPGKTVGLAQVGAGD